MDSPRCSIMVIAHDYYQSLFSMSLPISKTTFSRGVQADWILDQELAPLSVSSRERTFYPGTWHVTPAARCNPTFVCDFKDIGHICQSGVQLILPCSTTPHLLLSCVLQINSTIDEHAMLLFLESMAMHNYESCGFVDSTLYIVTWLDHTTGFIYSGD
jgi:hypothetical protein